MSAFLALMSAGTFGVADFIGGLATRRSRSAVQIVLLSEIIGLGMLVVAVVIVGGDLDSEDLIWAGGAGVAGVTGLILLYRGFAIGTVSVVAPIAGLGAAILPLFWGLATGERPSLIAGVGVVISLGAVALVSGASNFAEFRARDGIPEGVVAGALFGIFFILISNATSPEVWTITIARTASILVLIVVVAVGRISLRPPPGIGWMIVVAGIGDVVANLFFLAAERRGLLSLVAVISSLYPASTVLLARIVLKERMTQLQKIGLALAAIGVVLISFG